MFIFWHLCNEANDFIYCVNNYGTVNVKCLVLYFIITIKAKLYCLPQLMFVYSFIRLYESCLI